MTVRDPPTKMLDFLPSQVIASEAGPSAAIRSLSVPAGPLATGLRALESLVQYCLSCPDFSLESFSSAGHGVTPIYVPHAIRVLHVLDPVWRRRKPPEAAAEAKQAAANPARVL